jgi:hypothetical protein
LPSSIAMLLLLLTTDKLMQVAERRLLWLQR